MSTEEIRKNAEAIIELAGKSALPKDFISYINAIKKAVEEEEKNL